MTTARSPMSCSDAVEMLWELIDGDLDDVNRAALDRHLAWCLRCCGELEFARHLRRMLRERSHVTMPADVHGRLESFIDEVCGPAGGTE